MKEWKEPPEQTRSKRTGRSIKRVFQVTLLLLLSPLPLSGQQEVDDGIRFAVRAGFAYLGIGCSVGQQTGALALGARGRIGGRFALSAALDGYYRGSMACAPPGPVARWTEQGEEMTLRQGSFYPIRLGVRGHYAFAVSSLRLSLGAGLGGFPGTRITHEGRTAFSWQPWYGGVLGMHVPGAKLSGEFEIGRHSARSLTYLTTADARLVSTWRRWSWLIGGNLSYQIGS